MIRLSRSLLYLFFIGVFLLAQGPACMAAEELVETCEEKGEAEGERELPKFHPSNGHARTSVSLASAAAALIAFHAHEAAPSADHVDEVPVPPPEV